MLLIGISVDPGRTAIAGGFLKKKKKKNTVFVFVLPSHQIIPYASHSKGHYKHISTI